MSEKKQTQFTRHRAWFRYGFGPDIRSRFRDRSLLRSKKAGHEYVEANALKHDRTDTQWHEDGQMQEIKFQRLDPWILFENRHIYKMEAAKKVCQFFIMEWILYFKSTTN